MCDPVTVALVASAAFTAASARQQGNYQDKVARNNAVIQGRMAEDAIHRGKIAEDEQRQKTAQLKSAQMAKMAAKGVTVGAGSAGNVLADTEMMGELDALTIRSNAEREAYGYRVGANNSLAEGALAKSKGNSEAVGTILAGSAQVAGKWNTPKTTKTTKVYYT